MEKGNEKIMQIGDKIKLEDYVQRFTVKAVNKRFAILTKPLNCKKTAIYTIIDFKNRKRNRNNLVFNIYDYSKQEDIDECMKDLMNGECNLSHRGIMDLENNLIN